MRDHAILRLPYSQDGPKSSEFEAVSSEADEQFNALSQLFDGHDAAAWLCGTASIKTLGIELAHVWTHGLPSRYVGAARDIPDLGCPLLSHWLIIRTPQTATPEDRIINPETRALLRANRLEAISLHGHIDESMRVSFFALYFAKKPSRQKKAAHENMMEQLMVQVHRLVYRIEPPPVRVNALDLTRSEKEIMDWVGMGKSNWEIAQILGRSEWTIKTHLRNIFRKLDVTSRTSAVQLMMRDK